MIKKTKTWGPISEKFFNPNLRDGLFLKKEYKEYSCVTIKKAANRMAKQLTRGCSEKAKAELDRKIKLFNEDNISFPTEDQRRDNLIDYITNLDCQVSSMLKTLEKNTDQGK